MTYNPAGFNLEIYQGGRRGTRRTKDGSQNDDVRIPSLDEGVRRAHL